MSETSPKTNTSRLRAIVSVGRAWSVHTYWKEKHSPRYRLEWPDGIEAPEDPPDKWERGVPLEPKHLPLRIRLLTSNAPFPDIAHMWSCALCVSDSFREMLEAREPGVHQYFPLPVLMENGLSSPKNYFLLNVCNKISVSKAELYIKEVGMTAKLDVFHRSDVEGKHLWLSKVPSSVYQWHFVSDDMKKAMTKARFVRARNNGGFHFSNPKRARCRLSRNLESGWVTPNMQQESRGRRADKSRDCRSTR